MRSMILCILSLMAIPAAFAGGTWSNVTVTNIAPCTSAEGCGTSGFVQVTFSANSTGWPSCAADKNEAALDVTTDIGKVLMGVLQSARLSGSTVTAYGIGNCNLYPNTMETLGEVSE